MIDCEDVIKIYSDPETNVRIAALRGIDLKINKGEIVSIVGPSGSGKSTLIKILAGIEAISSGEARVGEFELEKMTLKDLLNYRLKSVGLVHQFPERTLFLTGSVWDNMTFSSSLSSKNLTQNKQENNEILKTLGIDHLRNRRVSLLSGGEMIRTAIACMLAKKAKLLLCDEPTGQLDSVNTEIVKNTLRQISREYDTTILVVTHDPRFLTGVDRTCEIYSGRVSSLYNAEESALASTDEFPLEFIGQLDSSQNVRVPREVYSLLQLNTKVKFSISKDSVVEIKHPEGLIPKKPELKELRKQKKLKIEDLPKDYFASKDVIIKATDISKIYTYKSLEIPAVTNVDMQIYSGELVFIIGPSGSGKTTLIKVVTGMEPSSSGEIQVLGEELHKLNDAHRAKFRRKNLGIVSQLGDLHPNITVRKNLFLKKLLSGDFVFLKKYPQTEIDDILEMFQITHRQESYPLEISGGELQRASLAIAKYGEPRILLLDEPTANMDGELAENVMEQLYQIHQQLGSTLIITTHDINLVRDGTRVIELKDGKISRDGIATSVKE